MTSLIVSNKKPFGSRGWNAFEDFESLVDRLFNSYYSYSENGSSMQMPVELTEKNNNLVLKAILPGLRKEDINIEVSEDQISLSGEYRSENEERDELIYRSEFYSGKFERIIGLPQKVDHQKAKAEYKDGILTITLPKSEKEINKVVKLSI
jgi:HSP20 family protein